MRAERELCARAVRAERTLCGRAVRAQKTLCVPRDKLCVLRGTHSCEAQRKKARTAVKLSGNRDRTASGTPPVPPHCGTAVRRQTSALRPRRLGGTRRLGGSDLPMYATAATNVQL